jgi:hypothetical protein
MSAKSYSKKSLQSKTLSLVLLNKQEDKLGMIITFYFEHIFLFQKMFHPQLITNTLLVNIFHTFLADILYKNLLLQVHGE